MNRFFKKVLVYLSVVAIVVQSLSPLAYLSLNSKAYAQEATPTPTIDQTTTPTPTDTPVPTPTDTITPTPTVTPAPTDTVTPTVTPTPTDTVTPTPTPVDNLSPPPSETPTDNNSTTQVQGDSTSVTPPPTPTVSPTPTPDPKTGNEQLNLIVLNNVSAPSIDLGAVVSQGSAVLTTDKPDYAPTDTALITGSNLLPNTTYTLRVWSDDQPPTGVSAQVTSDANGVFAYAYQLDGTYRPNYKAELRDSAGTIVATVTFTDSGFTCQNDVEGANDEPGQKDLTRMCADYTNVPSTIAVKWNWDETDWSGGNTGDGCSLYDTDGDGKVNYALCVTVGGSPAAYQSKTLYSCGDGKKDRCDNPITVLSPSVTTTCSAAISNDDPFAAGATYPNDTQGTCTVNLSDVGGSNAKLIDVCSYPSQQPNSDPSDCIVATGEETKIGKLEIKKSLSPSNDPGLFNLLIDGSVLVSDVTNNGTTGVQTVLASSGDGTAHTFGESAGTGTSLSNYTSTVSCVLRGTQTVVTTTGTNPWTINVVKDKDIVCTVTNTRINNGSITIIKDAVPNDAQDFAFTAGGGLSPTTFNLDDDGDNNNTLSNTKVFSSLSSGTYSVSEGAVTGWTSDGGVCSDGSPVSAISLQAGENVTCTFTNAKDATLTLVKTVVNNNGGTAVANDFQGKIDGGNVPWGVPQVVSAASHTASETTLSGYTASSWGTDCATNGSVTLTPGQNKTCTIINDDQQAYIIVDKTVINDNGGNAIPDQFLLTVDGGVALDGVAVPVNPGVHTAGETLFTGYTAGTWGGDCNANASITVALDETKTCTITNNDIAPKLHLRKVVTNDNGGTATVANFTLTADGTGTNDLSGTSPVDGGAGLLADTWALSETPLAGYTASAWVCVGGKQTDSNIKIDVGGEATCTITNDDIQPKLTVTKILDNKDLVNTQVSDFPLSVGNTSVLSGVQNGFNVGSYVVSEQNSTNYSYTTVITGDCDAQGNVTLAAGDVKSCTITNTLNTGIITVNKVLVPSNDPGKFDLRIDGDTQGTGGNVGDGGTTGTITLPTGTHNVSEAGNQTDLSNYTEVISGEGCGVNGIVNLTTDQNVVCTITNTRKTGTITFEKIVDGGSAEPGDWTFTVNGNDYQSEDSDTFNTGDYPLTESGPDGYTLTDATGACSLNPDNGIVTLNVTTDGETCIITNTAKAHITVEKLLYQPGDSEVLATNDNTLFNFSMTGQDNFNLSNEQSHTFEVTPGTYTVSENTGNTSDNYDFIGCSANYENGGRGVTVVNGETVTVEAGDSVTVTCENAQKYGTINGDKFNDIIGKGQECSYNNDDERTCQPKLAGWHIQLFQALQDGGFYLGNQIGDDEITNSDGNYTFPNVIPGEYFVCEEQRPGWQQTYPNDAYSFNGHGECYRVTVESGGEVLGRDFGNHNSLPNLTISKSNNAGGDKSPGDTVGFTITISASRDGGPADNVKVVDLLPKGFVFNSGSWKVVSSDTTRGTSGDITSLLTAPTYASPGTWNLGHMNSGETLTLTYTATIDGGQQAGTYYDNAWAVGNPVESSTVIFANAINPGDLDPSVDPSEFVGTQVAVVNNNQSGSYNTKVTKEVLGAETFLPATGENTLWVIIATLLSIAGFGTLLTGFKLKKKYE